jgi:hypothetical protein
VERTRGGGLMAKGNRKFILEDLLHTDINRFEKEQELVNSCKQLIEIFEQKIKDRIAKVWGTSTNSVTQIN